MRVSQTEGRQLLQADRVEFASVEGLDTPVSVDLSSQSKSVVSLKPEDYADKLEALHRALLDFQVCMVRVSPTDAHLRRGMKKAYEALVTVLGDENDE